MTIATFITKFTDEKLRRITLEKEACQKIGLRKGDYIKVTIEKVPIEK